MPKELAHLDASRLKVKPMAKRRPPKKTGAASDGQRPARTVFTKAVRALRNSAPASRHISKSRMCWERRPSGPAAEPAGNDRTALIGGLQIHQHKQTAAAEVLAGLSEGWKMEDVIIIIIIIIIIINVDV